jgi:N-acetylneuraminic acid mutarotase
VLVYRVATRRWTQLDDLPTPRHGVGVAALGGRVFVIGGGTEPGLTVSTANESLAVAP